MADADPDIRTELLAIIGRLDGYLGDPKKVPRELTKRWINEHVSYIDETSDAELWQHDLDALRIWANSHNTLSNVEAGYAMAAATRLLQCVGFGAHPFDESTANEVSQLHTLVIGWCPRRCENCDKPFQPDRLDEAWCPHCRENQGFTRSINDALVWWWKWNQPIPSRLLDSAEWNDFRQAFFERFHALLGYDNIGGQPVVQSANDVSRQQQAWAEFWFWLRRSKLAELDEHAWRETMLLTPIGDVTKLLCEPVVNAPAGPAENATPTKSNRKASVNARMMETIQANPDAMGWNSPKWAKELCCAKSAVVETKTWKDLTMRRDRERAERANDRRRRPKASDGKRG